MKKTFKHGLMALMLLCSFTLLSCNNKVTDEELDKLESSMEQLTEKMQEEVSQTGTISSATREAISKCIDLRDNLKEKSMTPAQSQRFEEDLNLRVDLLTDVLKYAE